LNIYFKPGENKQTKKVFKNLTNKHDKVIIKLIRFCAISRSLD